MLESTSAQQPDPDHTHLEPIIQHYSQYPGWGFVLPTVRNSLIEYSDLIRSLQQEVTRDEFLPYIAEYEVAKGSSINPYTRIFFYDRSKLPINHVDRIRNAICFPGFNFIFIEENAWSDVVSSEINMIFSFLDDYSNEVINQLPNVLEERGLEYKSASDEERAGSREVYVRLATERFSNADRLVLKNINKQMTLFHELGHCDLNLSGEEEKLSIMNENNNAILRGIIEDPNLNDILLNELFSNRGITVFEDNALLPEDIRRSRIAYDFLSVLEDIQVFANASVLSTRPN